MAKLPDLRSPQQIFGDLSDGFLSRVQNVTDLSKQSVITQLMQAISESNFAASAAIIDMIDAMSVDRAIGDTLQRLARDRNVPISSGRASTGKINITDTSFNKISSSIYAGQNAPVAGSQTLYVSDASKYATSGKLYIGRGTPNVEGPLDYIATAQEGGGAYWSITLAPTSLTTKFHNIGEEVVFAQGSNRLINSGNVVQTASGPNVQSVSFTTTSSATIPDGEVTVTNIPVICNQIGTSGNVAIGAIRETVGLPFASVAFNPQPFSNGTAADNDDTLRERIKAYEQSKSKGTEAAIKMAAIDVVSDDDLKTVTSANVIRYADNSSALVFDDGSGYEAIFSGIGLETIVDSALGGEKDVQLRKYPVAQSRVISNVDGPFNILELDAIDVEIKGDRRTHYFSSSDFRVPGSATIQEVVDSINSDVNFHAYATAAINSTRIALYPRDRLTNEIQVKSRTGSDDANAKLGFPLNIEYTIRLYKNAEPLYQDGINAKLYTLLKSDWNQTITAGDTLVYSVDGAPSITTTFTTAYFQAVEPTATVNASTSMSIWVTVMNRIMPGITASINGDTIQLTSNLGANDRASVELLGGSLLQKMFDTNIEQTATGRSSDYILNRQTGQLSLVTALATGESLTAGSSFTRANFLTESIPDGPTQAGNIWLTVDGSATPVPNGLTLSTKVTFSDYGNGRMLISGEDALSQPEGFEDVIAGDWVLIWNEANDNVSYPLLYANAGLHRVESIDGGIVINIDSNFTPSYGTENSIPVDRIAIVRSDAPVQHLSFSTGDIGTFIQEVYTDLIGIDATAVGSTVRLSTQSAALNGELYIVAADNGARALGLSQAQLSSNIQSHYGYTVTSDSEAGTPLFNHSRWQTRIDDQTYVDSTYVDNGGTLDNFAEILNDHETDVNGFKILPDSNVERRIYTQDYNEISQEVDLKRPQYLTQNESPIQADDRYFLRESYQFDSEDNTTFIVDNNTTTKSYTVPVARKIITNGYSAPTDQSFSADDAESSLSLSDPSSFYSFDFSDFKVWRQAQNTLATALVDLRFRTKTFGPAGNFQRVGFIYPTNKTEETLSYKVNVNESGALGIVLPASDYRGANWDGSTSFTTSVTTTAGKDEITYTYRVGTEPNFSNTGADVAVGDIVSIDPASSQITANKGYTGKVTNVTLNTFTVTVPTGTVQSDDIEIDTMINSGGITTVTTSVPHLVQAGNRVGLWSTATTNGLNYPFERTYYPTVISSTQFSFPTPTNVPGGSITSATHINGVITVNASGHGLSVGNVVLINTGNSNYDGLHPVTAVPNSNQFQYMVSGNSISIQSGTYAFQSFAEDLTTTLAIDSVSKSGTTVTVTCTGHTYTANSIIEIQGTVLDAWSNVTAYAVGSLVRYSGIDYEAIAITTNNQPDISPSQWAVTTKTLDGIHSIESVGVNTFTYELPFLGTATSTSTGTATIHNSQARIARALGANSDMLQFLVVTTTAQEVVDYVSTSMPDLLTAEIVSGLGTDVIDTSTADTQIATNYITANITDLSTIAGSRLIHLTVDTDIAAGSDIIVDTSGTTEYNRQYTVLKTVQSGSDYILTLQSNILAPATASLAFGTGTVYGATNYVMLTDGENWVKSSDLLSLPSLPQFTCKRAWTYAPAIGEEIRLVANTTDQLARFWGVLTVTGLSNVADISNSEYGRQLQVRTKTFGANGSIQATGGTASSGQVAVVGAGKESDTQVGMFQIPYESRKGLNARNWIELTQTVRQNKKLGFNNSTTSLTVTTNTLGLTGAGTFQTLRTTTQAAGSRIKIERHGKYTAIIGIDGASLGLSLDSANFVREGDWVKLRNVSSSNAYSPAVSYANGADVYYDGYTWINVSGGTLLAVTPNTTDDWRRVGLSVANQGIFRIVRVFGDDSFWIENSLSVEEIAELFDSAELAFYDYDSVMPGDTLIISGNILNSLNVGRYTVLDETTGGQFPTSNLLYVTPMNIAVGPTTLGDSYLQVNVEEYAPITLLKRILSVVPAGEGLAQVIVDSPNLMSRINSSFGAALVMQNKLNYSSAIQYGADSYRSYNGLVKQLNKVIYGDPRNSTTYPGVRAAGADVDIKPAIVKRMRIALSVRIRSGVPFVELRDRIKASVAGYINSLGVGEQVSLSRVVDAAGKINGVLSVVILSPTYDINNDLIAVGQDQRAAVLDVINDITVSILGT